MNKSELIKWLSQNIEFIWTFEKGKEDKIDCEACRDNYNKLLELEENE